MTMLVTQLTETRISPNDGNFGNFYFRLQEKLQVTGTLFGS